MTGSNNSPESTSFTKGWRFSVGVTLLVLGLISPVGAIFVGYSNLSTELKVTLSGLFLAGIPEIFTLVAVTVLGKAGFARIKTVALKLIRQYGPSNEVSRLRYHIGLAMFILPLLYALISAYAPLERISGFQDYKVLLSVVLDILFFGSFFVLGGNFWDKVRALFIHTATANFKT